MPVLLMEMTSDPSSPQRSAEEDPHTDREGCFRVDTGTKRRQRNRNAARKSRQKTTERADELHEELQKLERDNSALEKEIKSLRKELHLYTSALEKHKPHCCLKAPSPVPAQKATAPSLCPLSTSTPPHPETLYHPAPHTLFSEGPAGAPPTTVHIELQKDEKSSSSAGPGCYLCPVTHSTSDHFLPHSSMLSSPLHLPILPQGSLGPPLTQTFDSKPPAALGPSNCQPDSPVPFQDLSLVQLLEDNDWILNVE